MKRYLLLLIVVGLLFPLVNAAPAYAENFTVAIEPDEDFAHYNESYHKYDQPATPKWMFDNFVYLAFACLFLSFILTQKQRADLFGYLAPLPFLISSLMCTGLSGIDVVNGYGVGAVIEVPATGASTQNLGEFVLMMGHNIYINDMLAIFLFIMFIISLINCYRVYMEHELFQQSVGGGRINDGE